MDFNGTRREGREENHFFREVAEAVISRVHPTHLDPSRAEVYESWTLAGYRFATYLLPTRYKRFPEELDAFSQGIAQRLREYELKNLGPEEIEEFNETSCDKLEEKAGKFLRLATHENTPPDEARNAALQLAKMISSSEMTLVARDRAQQDATELARMRDVFKMIRQANPLLFMYGDREQNPNE